MNHLSGQPLSPGGPSFKPHFWDVFSEAKGNDRSASSGIPNDASRVLKEFHDRGKGTVRVDGVNLKIQIMD